MIKIASMQYAISQLSSWQQYTSKVESLVAAAKEQGAQLFMMPEYAGIEVAFSTCHSDLELFSQIQLMIPQYLEFYQELARHYQMYLQPGSIVVETEPHRFHNRAYFFGPQGYGYQNKLKLVTSEKESVILQSSFEQTVFTTAIGKIGIAICYDSEFPEIVRRLVQAEAMLILVPSYTPTLKSFNRVFYSCRARAIENQCYVLMSCAVGTHQFTDSFDILTGQANLFCPIDNSFPEDGILSQGNINEVTTMFGDISYEKLHHVREFGQVHNFNDSQVPAEFFQQEQVYSQTT